MLNRRQFLRNSAQSAAFLSLAGVAPAGLGSKSRIGLVQSTHRRLTDPASPEDPLDYSRVRAMVWQAIEYAGGLENRIRPGSWVVIKPNIVFLRPQQGYRAGDITDMRVTRAVLEYVAQNSRTARITVAEGGSYRGLQDPAANDAVTQNGERVDATTFVWGLRNSRATGARSADCCAS